MGIPYWVFSKLPFSGIFHKCCELGQTEGKYWSFHLGEKYGGQACSPGPPDWPWARRWAGWPLLRAGGVESLGTGLAPHRSHCHQTRKSYNYRYVLGIAENMVHNFARCLFKLCKCDPNKGTEHHSAPLHVKQRTLEHWWDWSEGQTRRPAAQGLWPHISKFNSLFRAAL